MKKKSKCIYNNIYIEKENQIDHHFFYGKIVHLKRNPIASIINFFFDKSITFIL